MPWDVAKKESDGVGGKSVQPRISKAHAVALTQPTAIAALSMLVKIADDTMHAGVHKVRGQAPMLPEGKDPVYSMRSAEHAEEHKKLVDKDQVLRPTGDVDRTPGTTQASHPSIHPSIHPSTTNSPFLFFFLSLLSSLPYRFAFLSHTVSSFSSPQFSP